MTAITVALIATTVSCRACSVPWSNASGGWEIPLGLPWTLSLGTSIVLASGVAVVRASFDASCGLSIHERLVVGLLFRRGKEEV